MFDLYKNFIKHSKNIQIYTNYKKYNVSKIQIYVYYKNFYPEIRKIFEI